MMHKIGITQWFLNQDQNPSSLQVAKEYGFSCIHINAGLPCDRFYVGLPSVQAEYLNQINQSGVKITAVSVNFIEKYGFSINSANQIEGRLLDTLHEIVFAAQHLKINLIYFPCFSHSRIKNKEDFSKIIKILQCACDLVQGTEIEIAVENTLSAQENLELIKRVNENRVRILLDTLNPLMWGHSIIEFIEKLSPFLSNQIHIKDGINGGMGNSRLGKGDAQLQNTISHLMKKQFDGFFVFENNYLHASKRLIFEDLRLFIEMSSIDVSK